MKNGLKNYMHIWLDECGLIGLVSKKGDAEMEFTTKGELQVIQANDSEFIVNGIKDKGYVARLNLATGEFVEPICLEDVSARLVEEFIQEQADLHPIVTAYLRENSHDLFVCYPNSKMSATPYKWICVSDELYEYEKEEYKNELLSIVAKYIGTTLVDKFCSFIKEHKEFENFSEQV